MTGVTTEDLPVEEAHLWQIDPDGLDAQVLERCRSLLTPEEEARVARMRLARGRLEQTVTRALVRRLLSRYAGVDPRAWRFRAGPHGRPEITAPAGYGWLRFNLSHTRGRVVVLLARDAEVGVDVEDTGRSGRLLEVADRYFSRSEVASLFALPEPARLPRFFDYWTLKESYIKARGLGLLLPLERFSFSLEPGRPIGVRFDAELEDDAGAWQFERLPWPPRHLAAVAIRRGRAAPDRRLWVREASL